jgi:phosphoglycerate dehydrogenase-like enzyme
MTGTSRPKTSVVVISPPDHRAMRYLAPLEGFAEISVSAEPEELAALLPAAEVVVFGLAHKSVDLPAAWKHARSVRWAHSLSAGVEGILFPALVRSSVPLTNARGVFKRSLAEFAVLGILFHYKRARRLIENQRAHQWTDCNVTLVSDRIMGVVGYGEIGRECALLGSALGMKVYALRRNPARSADDDILTRIFEPGELHAMLGGIDVLICALPLTRDTHHLIGDREFEAMQPNALVVNVGRGPVIDESALVRALINRRIAGASLDVFEQEPLPHDSPLWGMENVLISPHSADHTVDPDWVELTMRFFVENFHRYRNGEALENVVDKRAGY